MDAYQAGWIFRALIESGLTVNQVAREAKTDRITVLRCIRLAARERWRLPRHLPRVWILIHVDEKPCNHDKVPIPRGDNEYCCTCSRCGYDGHPELVKRQSAAERKAQSSLAERRFQKAKNHA